MKAVNDAHAREENYLMQLASIEEFLYGGLAGLDAGPDFRGPIFAAR